MKFMMELHRCRMRHHGEAMHVKTSTEDKFTEREILLAAGEMGRDCTNPEPLKYAADLIAQMFGPRPPAQPEPSLMDEIDDLIQFDDAMAEPEPPPTVPVCPGAHCVRVEAFMKNPLVRGPDCHDPTCVFGDFIEQLTDTDHLRPDHPVNDQLTFAEAGTRSSMRTGPQDLTRRGERVYWHLDALADWHSTRAHMAAADFIPSIKRIGYITVGSADWIRGDLGPEPTTTSTRKGEKSKVNVTRPFHPFTTLSFGSPNGALLIVHCNFDGYNYQGRKVPKEIEEILRDPEILMIQFDMVTLKERLDAGDIRYNGWVDARNLATRNQNWRTANKCETVCPS
jgi:hypothetical protein